MYLYIVDQVTMTLKGHIKQYSFIQWEDDLNGQGSFQITIPTSEEDSLKVSEYNDFIVFEFGVCGIIKSKSDSEDNSEEYNISGTLSNNILTWRSLLYPHILKGKITTVAHTLLINNFISPPEEKRKTDLIFLSDREEFYPTDDSVPIVNTQETGETVFDVINKLYLPYEYGFEAFPMLLDLDYEGVGNDRNLTAFMFRTLKPKYRTVGNNEGLDPVVFSFDLNNVSRLNHEENGTTMATVAIVAGPGEGTDRKIIEVSNPYTDYNKNRMEVYIDARDIQYEREDSDGNKITLTEKELEDELIKRGMEKLLDYQIFHSFDGSVIVEGENRYNYRTDYYKGDFVTVVDKKNGLMYDVQVIGATKSISSGVEHFDITFGWDNVRIKSITDNFSNYKVLNVTNISGGGSGGSSSTEIAEIKEAMGGFVFGYDDNGNAGYTGEDGKFYPWTIRYETPYDIIPWTKVDDGDNYFEESNSTWRAIKFAYTTDVAYSKFCINNPFDYIVVIPFNVFVDSGTQGFFYVILNDKKIFKINKYSVFSLEDYEFESVIRSGEVESFELELIPGVNELDVYFRHGYTTVSSTYFILESLIRESAKQYLYNEIKWNFVGEKIFNEIYDNCWIFQGSGTFSQEFEISLSKDCDYTIFLKYVNYSNAAYKINLQLNSNIIYSGYGNNVNNKYLVSLKTGVNKILVSGSLYPDDNNYYVLVRLNPVKEELEVTDG